MALSVIVVMHNNGVNELRIHCPLVMHFVLLVDHYKRIDWRRIAPYFVEPHRTVRARAPSRLQQNPKHFSSSVVSKTRRPLLSAQDPCGLSRVPKVHCLQLDCGNAIRVYFGVQSRYHRKLSKSHSVTRDATQRIPIRSHRRYLFV